MSFISSLDFVNRLFTELLGSLMAATPLYCVVLALGDCSCLSNRDRSTGYHVLCLNSFYGRTCKVLLLAGFPCAQLGYA